MSAGREAGTASMCLSVYPAYFLSMEERVVNSEIGSLSENRSVWFYNAVMLPKDLDMTDLEF